ncbi:hypothetical protein D3C78_852060 [compost metagenome]
MNTNMMPQSARIFISKVEEMIVSNKLLLNPPNKRLINRKTISIDLNLNKTSPPHLYLSTVCPINEICLTTPPSKSFTTKIPFSIIPYVCG